VLDLESGVLRTARPRKSRPRIRVVSRRLHMRLRAFDRPPAGGMSLRIAQLYATAALVRFRTMAVTSSCRNPPHQPRSVCEKRDCAGQEKYSEEVELAEMPPREGLAEEAEHEGILGAVLKKTDSLGGP